jgi:23S rRNA (cytosine1962-C5)-methyltransferase
MKQFPKLMVKAGEGRRVERGHLWVFANEVARMEPACVPSAGRDAAGADEVPKGRDEVSVFSAKGRFLGNALVSPSALLRARIYSRRAEPCDAAFIRRQLEHALEYRKRIGYLMHSYRLCYSEGDFLPGLIVDVYGDQAVVQITTGAMDARRALIVDALKEPLSPRCIYERSDVPTRALEHLPETKGALYGTLCSPAEIVEHGVTLLADLAEGQKTGFYLDQVENRARLLPFVKGRRVLDLFCYVGAWSLVSVAAGAQSAVGVDTSEPALALAGEAAKKNALARKCQFVREDASEFLKGAHKRRETFDCIVVDPPPLARRKQDAKNALRAYRDINLRALRVLAPGGILATASCSHHILSEDFLETVRLAARDVRAELRLLFVGGQSSDHPVHAATPETAYLKFFAFVRL